MKLYYDHLVKLGFAKTQAKRIADAAWGLHNAMARSDEKNLKLFNDLSHNQIFKFVNDFAKIEELRIIPLIPLRSEDCDGVFKDIVERSLNSKSEEDSK